MAIELDQVRKIMGLPPTVRSTVKRYSEFTRVRIAGVVFDRRPDRWVVYFQAGDFTYTKSGTLAECWNHIRTNVHLYWEQTPHLRRFV